MPQQSIPDKESIGDRMAIVEEAVELYLSDEASYTIQNLSKRLDVNPPDIYAYYPNKRAILEGYYGLLIDRYRMMVNEIEDFDEYQLEEKLSNFIYTSFDLMQEHREFVEETFDSMVVESTGNDGFNKDLKDLLRQFFKNDSNIASSSQLIMQDLFYEFLVGQYCQLIKFWLDDGSPEGEKSMAYADKMTTFLQEVMYTSVLDKGLDLLKFMAVNDRRFSRIPIIGSVTRKFFN